LAVEIKAAAPRRQRVSFGKIREVLEMPNRH